MKVEKEDFPANLILTCENADEPNITASSTKESNYATFRIALHTHAHGTIYIRNVSEKALWYMAYQLTTAGWHAHEQREKCQQSK